LSVIDASLVLALHHEGPLLRRTILSLREAAQHARAHGITVELVATLDRADDLTCEALKGFEIDGFDGWSVIPVDHGSLGPSRNSGIKAARGRYVYICDGDDLISANTITAMFRLAQATGRGHLIFHEYLCAFGDRPHCWKYFPLDVVSPLAFLEQHPYTSAAFAHRSVFEAVPYQDSGASSDYAFEDWHFNAECVARGLQILIAKGTIRFYRQRRGSLMDQAGNTTRQILPSKLFEPQTWVHITRKSYERLAASGIRPHEPDGAGWATLLDSATDLAFIRAANAIDPGIYPMTLRTSPFSSNLDNSVITSAIAYHEICRSIGAQRFDEVFLLPFIATGGAERYVGDVMQALYDMRPTSRMLVLLGEPLASRNHLDRVPPNATVIDLANDWPQLTMAQRQLIALKLIQSVAPQARLHLRSASFSEEFYGRFKSILRSNPAVYYRFGDGAEISPAGTFTRPWGFDFIAEHAQHLALILTDNETIIARDRKRIGIHGEKWRCLPARLSSHLTPADAAARASRRKGRVLWASRLDQQKRPELLARIAKKLEISDMQIDVFGSPVLDAFNLNCFAGLENLSYRGAYDGFAALDHGAYDAFLYTTAFDGMPNVVLEAIAAGLPVIAPDIGGIGEIIIDGDSGLLLPALQHDDEMAAVYAAAIIRLADDPALRARLVTGALRRLADRHDPAVFTAAVRAIFGGREEGAIKQRPAEHVAFLEEQIASLRRASLVAKARTVPQAALRREIESSADLRLRETESSADLRLREIESSRGYKLLQRYYALAGAPLTGAVIGLMRGAARRVLHLARRIRNEPQIRAGG
jgi:glycosyltransferase involved in cell wall biosynthesis